MAKNIAYSASEAYQIGYTDGEKDMKDKCFKFVKENISLQSSIELLDAVMEE